MLPPLFQSAMPIKSATPLIKDRPLTWICGTFKVLYISTKLKVSCSWGTEDLIRISSVWKGSLIFDTWLICINLILMNLKDINICLAVVRITFDLFNWHSDHNFTRLKSFPTIYNMPMYPSRCPELPEIKNDSHFDINYVMSLYHVYAWRYHRSKDSSMVTWRHRDPLMA